jgi:hypothetical protein
MQMPSGGPLDGALHCQNWPDTVIQPLWQALDAGVPFDGVRQSVDDRPRADEVTTEPLTGSAGVDAPDGSHGARWGCICTSGPTAGRSAARRAAGPGSARPAHPAVMAG